VKAIFADLRKRQVELGARLVLLRNPTGPTDPISQECQPLEAPEAKF